MGVIFRRGYEEIVCDEKSGGTLNFLVGDFLKSYFQIELTWDELRVVRNAIDEMLKQHDSDSGIVVSDTAVRSVLASLGGKEQG